MATAVLQIISFHPMTFNTSRNVQPSNKSEELDLLPAEFQPGDWDVICQRGKECFEHEGNIRFRATIERNLPRYERGTRQEKSHVVSEIVRSVRQSSAKASAGGSGGFVRKDLLTRRWYKVDDKVAREKCGQALRDMIKSRRGQGTKKRPFPSNVQEHNDASSDSEDGSSIDSKRQRLDGMFASNSVAVAASRHVEQPHPSISQSPGQQPLFLSAPHPFLPEHHLSSVDSTTMQATEVSGGAGSHNVSSNNSDNPILFSTFQNQLSAEFEPTPISDNLQRRTTEQLVQREDSTADLFRLLLPSMATAPGHSLGSRWSYPEFGGAGGSAPAPTIPRSSSFISWNQQYVLPTVIGTEPFSRILVENDSRFPVSEPYRHHGAPDMTKSSPDSETAPKPAGTTGLGINMPHKLKRDNSSSTL